MKPFQLKSTSVLRRNILHQYTLQIALYLFPLLTIPYLTRILGPDVFAIRAYALSFMGILVTLISYGFNSFGTREVARHRADIVYLGKLTSAIVFWRLMLAGVGACVLLLVTPSIDIMAENRSFMFLMYLSACFTGMLPDFVFQGTEDMGILTRRYVVSRLVSILLIFAFIRRPDQIILVAIFELAASIIAFFWSWIGVFASRGIRLSLRKLSRRYLSKVFRISTVFFLSSASTAIFTGLTTIMIGIYISDPAQISYWSLSMTVVSAIQSLFTPFTNSIYPHVVVTHNLKPVKKALKLGFPLIVVGCVTLFFCAEPVMQIIGGPEYISGAYILQIVIPTILLSFPSMMIGFPVLAAVDREKQLTVGSVSAALFHIVGLVTLALTGSFTIVAVAVLRSITEAIMLGFRIVFVSQWRGQVARTEATE